jgi:HD domain
LSRTTNIPTRLKTAVYVAATLAGTVMLALLPRDADPSVWLLAGTLAAVAAGLDFAHMRLSRTSAVSISDIPLLGAVLLLPTGLAMAVGGIAAVIPRGRLGWVSRGVNFTAATIPAGLSSAAFILTRSFFGVDNPQDGVWLWLVAALIALSVYPPLHYTIAAIWTWKAYGASFWQWIRDGVMPILQADPVSILLVAPLVELSMLVPSTAAALPVVVGVGCAAGVWIMVRTMHRQVEARDLKDEFFRAIFVSLARLLEMKDPDTAEHSARVAVYAHEIAAKLGLSKEEQSRIHLAGLLHDVGKVGVPDDVLLKPGRLSADERAQMERHSRLSAEAIAGIPGFSDLTRMVYAHHERIDGSGYPEGIMGPEIPLGAKILGVADTFEALTSDRPYRAGRPADVALSVIDDEIHLFDPRVVDALQSVVASGSALSRMNNVTDFSGEWSRAAKHLDVRLDEESFTVPAERPRTPSPVTELDAADSTALSSPEPSDIST